jgi:hypothetical protein
MQNIDWHFVSAGMIATVPAVLVLLGILGTIIWNLIEVRGLRNEFHIEVPTIRERLAKIEQRLDDAHIGSTIIHAGG